MKLPLISLLLAWAATAVAQVSTTDAEVRKVDAAVGKLTLKHGEIKNLDMPAMTMVFRVADRSMLAGLQPGDKVRVHVEKLNGQYTVTAIEAAR